MKGFGEKLKDKKYINISKTKLFEKALNLHSQGEIKETKKYYKYLIEKKFDNCIVYSNYGLILKKEGNLKEAEIALKKAIKLNPNWSEAHSNLGSILKDLGKLKEAELYLRKAIELNPKSAVAQCNLGNTLRELKKYQEAEIALKKAIKLNPSSIIGYANLGNMLKGLGRLGEAKKNLLKTIAINPEFVRAYYSLSRLKYDVSDKYWHDYLFSERFLNNKSEKEKIDIYFARSNLLHNEKNFLESAKNLQMANKLKLELNPSEVTFLLKKSKLLLSELNKNKKIEKTLPSYPVNIFIVGMPRCGSTLVESIISLNTSVKDLGEVNILEKAYIESKKIKQSISLMDLYIQKIDLSNEKFNITSNKWLFNYQYAGIIASQISNSKIIHCLRNPLDNILSISRANFDRGNYYSSSLRDCAKVYLDQKEIMQIYKNKFSKQIYELDYDLLVKNPNETIKSLIKWLDWEWNEKYLFPHLNKRAVLTASDVQVRSPINTNSKGGWKNYKKMLSPVFDILKNSNIKL